MVDLMRGLGLVWSIQGVYWEHWTWEPGRDAGRPEVSRVKLVVLSVG